MKHKNTKGKPIEYHYLLVISSYHNPNFEEKRKFYTNIKSLEISKFQINHTGTIILYIVGTLDTFQNNNIMGDIDKIKLIPKDTYKQLGQLDEFHRCVKLAGVL